MSLLSYANGDVYARDKAGHDERMTASSHAPVVALRRVAKTFANGVHALDGLDLQVRPREFLTILGPSGCGKSTALRIIAGLSEPTRGRGGWGGAARGGGGGA